MLPKQRCTAGVGVSMAACFSNVMWWNWCACVCSDVCSQAIVISATWLLCVCVLYTICATKSCTAQYTDISNLWELINNWFNLAHLILWMCWYCLMGISKSWKLTQQEWDNETECTPVNAFDPLWIKCELCMWGQIAAPNPLSPLDRPTSYCQSTQLSSNSEKIKTFMET